MEVHVDGVLGWVGLFAAGIVAGAINSVAGGGSLVSFSALIAFGIPSILANATNTAAVCPGALSSAYAYRHDLSEIRHLLPVFILPSLIGGLFGAIVLAVTPESLFARLVPFLILFATLLFACRDIIAHLMNTDPTQEQRITRGGQIWGFSFQLFVASYGGYFGAGIGILMLASLSLMGLRDIHRMNALKTVLGFIVNGTALIYFILKGLVIWYIAVLMAAGAIIGGYAGARLAKKVNQQVLRWFIVAVGLAVSAWLFSR